MYELNVSLKITCMYDMSVHGAAHNIYTQPNHIRSESK